MTKGRLEALSDGVIAIVLTILVLEFKVPHLEAGEGDAELFSSFIHSLPVVLSYVISFLILIVWWMSHHQLLHAVKQINRTTIFLNGIFLMFIALIPYPTALMGEYPELRFPAILYGVIGLLCGASYYGLYHHLLKVNVDHPFTSNRSAVSFKGTWLFLVVYLVAIGFAFITPYLSVAVYAAIPIYFFLKKWDDWLPVTASRHLWYIPSLKSRK
ncbi:TMEM175 family protein [Paenibacillus sp. N1-5-1-14]|nr:TMEM175 family protein [Paenibacillus radicibacter]